MGNSETITKVAILLLEQGQPDAAFEVLTSVQDWVTDGQLTLRVAFVDNDLLRELGSLPHQSNCCSPWPSSRGAGEVHHSRRHLSGGQ
jgi:hypothetical protein